MQKPNLVFVATLTLSLLVSGCLKSRMQIKEEAEEQEANKPVRAHVEPAQPQGLYALDEIKGEMTRLQGRVEELERSRQDASVTNAQKEEVKKHEGRIVELEHAQLQMLEVIKKLQEAKPAQAAEQPESFDRAKAQFDAKNYDAAIEGFNSYLKNHKAPKTEEATFYRGEAYFALKQYKKAIVDYSKFPEKYTHSKHMTQALYKIGLSFDAMGMKEDSKGFYQELIDKFPKSAEAKKARAKIK